MNTTYEEWAARKLRRSKATGRSILTRFGDQVTVAFNHELVFFFPSTPKPWVAFTRNGEAAGCNEVVALAALRTSYPDLFDYRAGYGKTKEHGAPRADKATQ